MVKIEVVYSVNYTSDNLDYIIEAFSRLLVGAPALSSPYLIRVLYLAFFSVRYFRNNWSLLQFSSRTFLYWIVWKSASVLTPLVLLPHSLFYVVSRIVFLQSAKSLPLLFSSSPWTYSLLCSCFKWIFIFSKKRIIHQRPCYFM